MGPALLIKAPLQGCFSLMVFGWTQILIDLQPLVVMLSGRGHIHGWTHTYLGATFVGLTGGVTGKYLGQLGLAILSGRRWAEVEIRWWVAILSGLIGSYSHIVLDSIMNRDMRPLAPWSDENELLELVPVRTLHEFCLLCGLLGATIVVVIAYRRAPRVEPSAEMESASDRDGLR